MGWLSAAKLVGWIAGKTGLKDMAVKWILIAAVVLVLVIVGWRAWAWIDGMRNTIAAQKEEISDRDVRIGVLTEGLRRTVEIANRNADELAAEQARTQSMLDKMARLSRDNQRRESRLEEALHEIDKWPARMDGDIGPGLRGVLDQLRRKAAVGPAGGDQRPGDVHHGP